jgi:hypothetical protein
MTDEELAIKRWFEFGGIPAKCPPGLALSVDFLGGKVEGIAPAQVRPSRHSKPGPRKGRKPSKDTEKRNLEALEAGELARLEEILSQ